MPPASARRLAVWAVWAVSRRRRMKKPGPVLPEPGNFMFRKRQTFKSRCSRSQAEMTC